MPRNPKTIQPPDIADANRALGDATAAIAAAKSRIPAAGTVLILDDSDETYQKLNDAKSDIEKALSALGGRPCGGGRPC
jgi:hypothetical protein